MPTDTTQPDTPTTERALPPAGETSPARSGARAVPGPSATPAGRPSALEPRGTTRAARGPRPGSGGNGTRRPSGPEEMREEIERTRARMSGTLDALEARIEYERQSLEEKKDELVDLATLKRVRRKLAREPWRSMAIAFAAGYIIAAIRD